MIAVPIEVSLITIGLAIFLIYSFKKKLLCFKKNIKNTSPNEIIENKVNNNPKNNSSISSVKINTVKKHKVKNKSSFSSFRHLN